MWNVSRRFNLALSDLGRRAGLAVAAGVLAAIAAGFLLAALWSWLAHGVGWGPVLASLAVAGLCLLVAFALLLVARHRRHAMPTAGDVRAEAEARAKQAAEAAFAAVKVKAEHARTAAGQRLYGLVDRGRYKVDRAASGLDAAAGKLAENAADPVAEAVATARGMAEQFARSRAAPGVALATAFAVGLALANLFGHDEDD